LYTSVRIEECGEVTFTSPSWGINHFQSLTVVIPAYNEERFIGSVVIHALRYAPRVVVIDDGSSDATAYIAEQAGATVIKHETNLGKSEAVNTALKWAKQNGTQALVFIDGDGQHKPDEILRVFEPILAGKADLVVGSRFLTIKSEIPVYRQIGQHLLTSFINLASNVAVTDSQSGFRAYSRRAIEVLHFNGSGLSVESEMQFLIEEHTLRVVEVPISVIYKEKSKRNPFSHGMQIVSNVARLMGQHRPLLMFGLPGLFALVVGVIMGLLVFDIYSKTHEVALGYSLITIMLIILGVLSIFVGLILHSVRAFFLDLKKTVQHNCVLSNGIGRR